MAEREIKRLVVELDKATHDRFRKKLFPVSMKTKITEWIKKYLDQS